MTILKDLPKILSVKDIATAIGWSVQRTRRTLKKLGALKKRGGLYFTTRQELAVALPEVLDVMEDE